MVYFNVEMQDNINMRKDKKFFCAAARFFWPEGHFWDFFGLKEAKGLLKAKKSQKRAEGQKILAKAQNNFLSFQMVINVVH